MLGNRCGCHGPGVISRRGLALVLGGAAAWLADPAAAEPSVAARRWIDVHHHIMPPFYAEASNGLLNAQANGHIPPLVAQWTPAASLDIMDKVGIETSILSISTPGIWFGGAEASARLASRCNDYAAELVSQHPRRFGMFAALPLPDTDASLKEIARAMDGLKADGVGLMTSYGDRWLGDPSFAPVLEELNRRKSVIYVHPTAANCCKSLQPGIAQPMVEFVFDTTRAIISLLFSGALARYPDIKFIFSHAGGTLPMLAGRIEEVGMQTRPDLPKLAPKGVLHELTRLHFDVANSLSPASFAAVRAFAPMSQLLLGTDYPFQPPELTIKGFGPLGLTAAEQAAVGRNNALALFPRLG